MEILLPNGKQMHWKVVASLEKVYNQYQKKLDTLEPVFVRGVNGILGRVLPD